MHVSDFKENMVPEIKNHDVQLVNYIIGSLKNFCAVKFKYKQLHFIK